MQASSRQEIELIPLGTFEVPKGKALEFWTKADEWQAPVSLGLVDPGQPIRLRLDELPPLEDNQLFELTLEDETGSATGLPTGPIELIGRAVEHSASQKTPVRRVLKRTLSLLGTGAPHRECGACRSRIESRDRRSQPSHRRGR